MLVHVISNKIAAGLYATQQGPSDGGHFFTASDGLLLRLLYIYKTINYTLYTNLNMDLISNKVQAYSVKYKLYLSCCLLILYI